MTRPGADQSSHLGSSAANTKPGSHKDFDVAPAPNAYLRLDTGEVIGVPGKDETELKGEFDKWNRLMHEQLLANDVLAACDERLENIAQALAKSDKKEESALRETKEEAERVQGFAVQWRDDAAGKLRHELQPLAKLGEAGKKLVELIPVIEKEGDSPARFSRGKDDGAWRRDALDLKKSWGFRSAAGLRDQMMEKESYRGVGPLRVVSSDKLKEAWPKFKDRDRTKWSEVYAKSGKDGKRKIDRAKMRQYLGEQVMELSRVRSKDFVKLAISDSGTLGPEALSNWNDAAQFSREGKLGYGDIDLCDIDLSGEAAAMRYFTGASLEGEIAPLKGRVSVRAEARAEVSFAEARADASLYLPSKAGVLLYLLDLEQAKALALNRPMPRPQCNMGAIRLVIEAELMGSVGVCVAGELSLDIEMKDVEATDLDGKKKPAKQSRIRGGRKKGAKRARAVEVAGNGSEWKDTGTAAGELALFAGARAGLELKGSLEWRNPHSKEKRFEMLASIAPQLGAQLGIGGSLKLAVEYVDGIFRITAHASLCVGLGAEGTVCFAVGAEQLASFVGWAYYSLLHSDFVRLSIFLPGAFTPLVYLTCLVVCEGKDMKKDIEGYFLKTEEDLKEKFNNLHKRYKDARAACELGKRILAHPEAARLSPPETKGILLHQLTRHGAESILAEPGLGSGYLRSQKQAVLAILRQTQTKADLENVIQHMHPKGEKVTLAYNLGKLREFFSLEGPGGMDFPGSATHEKELEGLLCRRGVTCGGADDAVALRGDFSGWYDKVHASLKDSPVRGFPALPNDSPAYALRDSSHPLWGSFYSLPSPDTLKRQASYVNQGKPRP